MKQEYNGVRFMDNAALLEAIVGTKYASRVKHLTPAKIASLTVEELQTEYKLTHVKAKVLAAAAELNRRKEDNNDKRITCSAEIADHFRFLADMQVEEFWCAFLNKGNRIVKTERISIGGITSCIVDVRMIMKVAVMNNACALILCHNHPSGNLQPSDADVNITRKIYNACLTMEIQLLDHVIVGGATYSAYYSLADNGLIPTHKNL